MLLKLELVAIGWRKLVQYVKDLGKIEENESCFDLNEKILSYAGLWHDTDEQPSRTQRFTGYVAPRLLLAGGSYLLFFMYPLGIYRYKHNILIIFEEVILEMVILMSLSKVGCLVWQYKGFRKLVDDMEDMFNRSLKGAEWEKEMMITTLQRSKLFTKAYVAGSHFPTIIFVLIMLPIFRSKRIMIYNGWWPYDEKASPNLEITLVSNAVVGVLSLFMIVYVDALLMALVMQVVAQFQALRHTLLNIKHIAVARVKIRDDSQRRAARDWKQAVSQLDVSALSLHLGQKERNEKGRNVRFAERKVSVMKKDIDLEMEALLKECVDRHVLLISYVQGVCAELQLIMFIQILCNIVLTGFICLYLTLMPPGDVKGLTFLAALIGCLLELGIICYFCNEISEESSLVKDAIFGCDWLEASARFKKAMRIMISTANRPILLKIGGFVPMTVATFFYVTKFTYSYYMSLITAIRKNQT